MKKPLSIFFPALITLLFSCNTPEKREETARHKGLTPRGKKANIDKAKTYSLITVEIGTPRDQIQVTEEHLHGKFFKDRAEFYVVEEPELFISSAEVGELTLYFIDGTLCKKKYLLDKDISTELIKSYGGFKFIPLNTRTRTFARSEYIVQKTDEGNVLNEKLDRFELKWNEEEVLIRYNLEKDSLSSKIYLMEELSAYKKLLDAAEREII